MLLEKKVVLMTKQYKFYFLWTFLYAKKKCVYQLTEKNE